jgi:hypothetical protein
MEYNIECFGDKARKEGKELRFNFIPAQIMGISYITLYYSEGGQQELL